MNILEAIMITVGVTSAILCAIDAILDAIITLFNIGDKTNKKTK